MNVFLQFHSSGNEKSKDTLIAWLIWFFIGHDTPSILPQLRWIPNDFELILNERLDSEFDAELFLNLFKSIFEDEYCYSIKNDSIYVIELNEHKRPSKGKNI